MIGRPNAPTAIAIGIAVLLLLVRLLAPSFFMTMTRPLLVAGSALSNVAAAGASVFTSHASLEKQRDDALAAQAILAGENQILAAKVADLTALLGSRAEAPAGILAAVLARPPVAAYDELVIDAGGNEGVAQGAMVFGNGGIPLGTVSGTTAHAARVSLYSTSGRSIDALVGASRVPVRLTGQGAGAFTASVPRDAGVAVGDALYIVGPGSLPIGTVSSLDSDPSSPTATLHIQPFVNPFTISWVTVSRMP